MNRKAYLKLRGKQTIVKNQSPKPLKENQPAKKGGVSNIAAILPKGKGNKKGTTTFNYANFKDTYKEEHDKIESDIFKRLTALYETAKGKGLDMEKIREIEKQVILMLPQHCEKWYKEHVLKKG